MVKVIVKALAVTFFYYLCGTTRTYMVVIFWLMNASAGGKALPPAFFLHKIWIYKKRFVFLRKRYKRYVHD